MSQVLIVDDTPSFSRSLGTILKKCGHEVAFAHDGSEALKLLKKKNSNFDLVLLDYHMPLWDGVETMVLFRSRDVKIPVIAYTCKDRKTTSPFESVMTTLGTVASVRCADGVDELISTTEKFLNERSRPLE